MPQVISREGDCATVGTWAELTSLGSSGTMPRPAVGKGITRIRDLFVTHGDGVSVLTANGGGRFLRFSGATRDGEQIIGIGGWGMLNTGNTGFYFLHPVVLYKDVNIALKAGEELIVEGMQSGTDHGGPTIGYTAICDSGPAPVRNFITREGDITALDTDTALTVIPGSSSTGMITVPFNGKITRLFGCYGHKLPLATAAGGTAFVKLGNEGGFEGPDIYLPVGGVGSLSTTVGTQGGFHEPIVAPQDVVCKQGQAINVRGQQVGVDHGTARPWVTVEFTKVGT